MLFHKNLTIFLKIKFFSKKLCLFLKNYDKIAWQNDNSKFIKFDNFIVKNIIQYNSYQS